MSKIGLDEPPRAGANDQRGGFENPAPRRRRRVRYADSAQVDRAAELAKKHGLALELTADGAVKILGKLDTARAAALASREEETPDEALAAWEAKYDSSRRT
jgi:hypothetical protein